MLSKATKQSDVLNFLHEVRDNAKISILESGAERDELIEIASSRGIILKDNIDLAGLKLIYAFTDIPNKNNARLPKAELLKAMPSIVGKPLDINHDRGYVIGSFIDSRFIAKDNLLVAYAIFYKSNFAEEWEYAKELFAKGELKTSFEIWAGSRKKLEDGTYELYDMELAGGAILFDVEPAFDGCTVLEIAKKKSAEKRDMVFASTQYKAEELLTTIEAPIKASEKIADTSEATKEAKVMETPIEQPKVEEAKVEEVKAETVVPVTDIKAEITIATEPIAVVPIVAEEKKVKVVCSECQCENDMCEDDECTECSKCKNKIDKMGKVIKAAVEEVKVEVAPVEVAKAEEVKAEAPVTEPVVAKVEEVKVEAPIEIAKVEEVANTTVTVTEAVTVTNTDDPEKIKIKSEENFDRIELDKDGNIIGTSSTKYVRIEEYKKMEDKCVALASEIEQSKKVKEESEKLLTAKIEFYKANAIEIANRKTELGEFAKDVDDFDLMNDTKYTDIKLIKANKDIEESSKIVGKTINHDKIRTMAKEIEVMAFPNNRK